jgi:serine/threonine kinase 33
MLKFDPAKRMTAREIEGHPWITGDTKVIAVKPNVLDLMRSYNAERRLKKILITVLAAVRFMSVLNKNGLRSTPISSESPSFLSLEDSSTTSTSSLAKSFKDSHLMKKHESGAKTSTASDKSKISVRKESKPKLTTPTGGPTLNTDIPKLARHRSFKETPSYSTLPEKLTTKSKSTRPSRTSKDDTGSRSPQMKSGLPQLRTSSTTLQTVKAPSNRARNAPRKSVDLGPKIGELK